MALPISDVFNEFLSPPGTLSVPLPSPPDPWLVAEEQRVLFKLDAVLLTFMSLGYFLKNLSNINSAFISGMKEALGMERNELTTAITCWTVGYVIGQIPSTLILTQVSPRLWIPALEVAWGLVTLASYRVANVRQLYLMRFMVGLCEAGFYPGAQYLLGCFYKPSELGKRSILFHTAGGAGALCSSLLQSAAYIHLTGRGGLEGWRWLFILDGVITLPIALAGFVFLPSAPGQASYKPNFWLSQLELEIITARMDSIGRAPSKPLTQARLRMFTTSWRFWVLPILYTLWNNSGGASSIMPLWLKSLERFTVPQINLYIMPITMGNILAALLFAWASDGPLRGVRWPPILFVAVFNAGIVFTLDWLPIRDFVRLHWFLYYLTGINGSISGLFFTWANEICGSDSEERSVVLALMNDLAYLVQAIAPNFVWKQVDYPKATRGLVFAGVLSVTLFGWVFVVRYFERRDQRRWRGSRSPEAVPLLKGSRPTQATRT